MENAIGRIQTLMSAVNDGNKDAEDEALPDSAVAVCDFVFSATTIIKPRSWLKIMRKRFLFINEFCQITTIIKWE